MCSCSILYDSGQLLYDICNELLVAGVVIYIKVLASIVPQANIVNLQFSSVCTATSSVLRTTRLPLQASTG